MAGISRRAVFILAAIVVVLGALLILKTSSGKVQVERVSHADPALQAATKRAQNEIDIFINEIKNPVDGDQFFVKGGFKTDDSKEYLWVKRVTYYEGLYTGILDQVPMSYTKAHKGDEVTVKQEDVYDWMIKNGDHMRGGYTEKVLNSR